MTVHSQLNELLTFSADWQVDTPFPNTPGYEEHCIAVGKALKRPVSDVTLITPCNSSLAIVDETVAEALLKALPLRLRLKIRWKSFWLPFTALYYIIATVLINTTAQWLGLKTRKTLPLTASYWGTSYRITKGINNCFTNFNQLAVTYGSIGLGFVGETPAIRTIDETLKVLFVLATESEKSPEVNALPWRDILTMWRNGNLLLGFQFKPQKAIAFCGW